MNLFHPTFRLSFCLTACVLSTPEAGAFQIRERANVKLADQEVLELIEPFNRQAASALELRVKNWATASTAMPC